MFYAKSRCSIKGDDEMSETLPAKNEFENEIETAFLQNMETFHQLKNNLLIEHKGEYVAILDGKPVDFDVDDEKLAQRMYEKYGDVPFFIAFVSTEPVVFDLPISEKSRVVIKANTAQPPLA